MFCTALFFKLLLAWAVILSLFCNIFMRFIFTFIVFALWQGKVFVLFLCKENAFRIFSWSWLARQYFVMENKPRWRKQILRTEVRMQTIGYQKWGCYITVDFATNISQNSACKTQHKCHLMVLFHNCCTIKDGSDKNLEKNAKKFFVIFYIQRVYLWRESIIELNKICDAALVKSTVSLQHHLFSVRFNLQECLLNLTFANQTRWISHVCDAVDCISWEGKKWTKEILENMDRNPGFSIQETTPLSRK